MGKKKACFNKECSNYTKTKYKASKTVCPVCEKDLGWVCSGKKCFKMIPETEKYCAICKADANDTIEKTWDVARKVCFACLGLVPFAVITIWEKFKKRD